MRMWGAWQNMSTQAWFSLMSLLVLVVTVAVQTAGWKKDRFSRSLDTITALHAHFESMGFREMRRKAAYFLKDGPQYDHAGKEAVLDVLNFFDAIGFLLVKNAIDAETVWRFFGSRLMLYYAAAKPLIDEYRITDPEAYLDFKKANKVIGRIESERHPSKNMAALFSAGALQKFLESEASITSIPRPGWVPQSG
jgi:hypothetical protein